MQQLLIDQQTYVRRLLLSSLLLQLWPLCTVFCVLFYSNLHRLRAAVDVQVVRLVSCLLFIYNATHHVCVWLLQVIHLKGAHTVHRFDVLLCLSSTTCGVLEQVINKVDQLSCSEIEKYNKQVNRVTDRIREAVRGR